MGSLFNDARFAVRRLAKNSGFTATALLTLALGIGPTAVLFSAMGGVLVRPLPFHEPQELVWIWEVTPQGRQSTTSPVTFLDWRRESQSFSQMAAYDFLGFDLGGLERPESVVGAAVSANLFDVLGVQPALGRDFDPEEEQPGNSGVVVLSHRLWERKFAASDEALGRTLLLNDRPYKVIGVLPKDFWLFLDNLDVFVPLSWDVEILADRANRGYDVIARPRDGVPINQAQAEMDHIARQLAGKYPAASAGWGARLQPVQAHYLQYYRPALRVMLLAVGVVLLITCANVANLLLAQGLGRQREFAIRMAVGAGRGTLAPAVGRGFTPEEAREPVAVISHQLWARHFARDANVAGLSLRLSGTLYRVTGVLPADYRDPMRPVAGRDVYVPVVVPEHDVNARNSQWLQVIARLRDGRTLEQARSIIEPASEQAYRALGGSDPRSLPGFTVIPLREHQVGEAKAALWLILGAVAFVLLIGCANVANLLLARLTSRSDELAVRAAVGASRGRLAAQLMTESLLLSVLGGIGALVFVLWGLDLVKALSPLEIPWMERSRFDLTVFAFAFLASLVSGLLFGVLPAARGARLDLLTALKAGKSGSPRHRRALNALLVGEVALTMTLLVGASLALMSFVRLSTVDPGFDSADILTVEMTYAGEWQRSAQAAFAEELVKRVHALPGVRYAGLVDNLPLSGSWSQTTTKADSYFGEVRPELQGQSVTYEGGTVAGEYFRAMGIPLMKGRYFTPEDGATTPLVVIVSEDLARHLWGDADPLGRRVGLYDRRAGKSNWASVVGVVGAIRHRGLDLQTNPTLYRLLPQAAMGNPVLVLRGEQPERFAPAVREIARQLDAAVIVNRARPFDELLRAQTAAPRFLAVLLGSFALFALLLAAVGIYGVLSYAVSQRRQEIGIRMALGARPGEVMWMTVRGGMVFAITGIAIGVGSALWLSRFMKTLLFEVSVADPMVYASIAVFLAGVALLACWLPARRAARVDPMVALRYE